MKMKRRITAAALAVLTVLTPLALFGCGGGQKMPEKQVLENVYRITEIPIPENMSWMYDLSVEGEKIRITGTHYDEKTYESWDVIYEMDVDGTNLTDITPPRDKEPIDDPADIFKNDDPNVHTYEMTRVPLADGTLWVGTCTYTYDPITYTSTEKYTFKHTAADGTIIEAFTEQNVFGAPQAEGEYRSLYNLTVCGDGSLLIGGYDAGEEVLFLRPTDAESFTKLDTKDYLTSGYIQHRLTDGDDLYFLHCGYTGSKNVFSLIPLDTKTAVLGEPLKLEGDYFDNMYNFFEGEGYTFYFMNETAVYGFDLETKTAVEVLNFMNSDLNYNVAYNMKVISPEKFVTYGYDSFTQTEAIFILDRVPEDELVPKYIIDVAVLADDWTIREEAVRFNRQSDEYRVNIRTYKLDDYLEDGQDYNYDELIEKAVTAMNNDIIAGRGPDILLTNTYMPIESYIAKGLLLDLYPLIDKDERFSRDDFLPNVLEALDVDGKLYEIFPSFSIQTLAGKTSVVGDRTSWTMSDFARWARNLPETTKVFFDLYREDVFDLFLSFCYEEFIDADTGTCSFDSIAFSDLLSFVASLPERPKDDSGIYGENYWLQYDNRFREDLAALEQVYMSSFNVYTSLVNYTFYTRDITLVGAPTDGENGGAIIPGDMSFAISSKTALKDGAWQFVSYFLTKEYQEKNNYYFPIRTDALDAMMEEAIRQAEEEKKRYEEMMGGNGDIVIDDGIAVLPETFPTVEMTTALPETEIAVEEETDTAEKEIAVVTTGVGGIIGMPSPYPGYRDEVLFLDREIAEMLRDYVKSVSRVMRQNQSVTSIIKEDAGAYFAGQKSLEETVKLIQNRVSTYVAENS